MDLAGLALTDSTSGSAGFEAVKCRIRPKLYKHWNCTVRISNEGTADTRK